MTVHRDHLGRQHALQAVARGDGVNGCKRTLIRRLALQLVHTSPEDLFEENFGINGLHPQSRRYGTERPARTQLLDFFSPLKTFGGFGLFPVSGLPENGMLGAGMTCLRD
jgi:hypothetical protein